MSNAMFTRVSALIAAGVTSAASAQTYTRFDALPNGTFPTQMDASGRIVGTAIQTGQPTRVFVRNTDRRAIFHLRCAWSRRHLPGRRELGGADRGVLDRFRRRAAWLFA